MCFGGADAELRRDCVDRGPLGRVVRTHLILTDRIRSSAGYGDLGGMNSILSRDESPPNLGQFSIRAGHTLAMVLPSFLAAVRPTAELPRSRS